MGLGLHISQRIIDVHIHPVPSLPEEELVREAEEAGLEKGILLAVDVDPSRLRSWRIRRRLWKRIRNSQTLHSPHAAHLLGRWASLTTSSKAVEKLAQEVMPRVRTENAAVARLVERYPNLFVGFGSVDPTRGSRYVKQKLKKIASLRLRGIKLLPTVQFFNPSRERGVELVAEFCEKNRMAILFHTGCDPGPFEIPEVAEDANPKYLIPLLERYSPQVILAHMGYYSALKPGIWVDEALRVAKRFDNVWLDTAAIAPQLFRDDRQLTWSREKTCEKIRREIGFDKVLFGSDYPLVPGSSIKSMARSVMDSPLLTQSEKEMVLYQNAKEFLRLIC